MTIIRSSYTASEKIVDVELAQNTSLANAERVKGIVKIISYMKQKMK